MRVRIKNKGLYTTVYFFTIPVSSGLFKKTTYETFVYCKDKDGRVEKFSVNDIDKFE